MERLVQLLTPRLMPVCAYGPPWLGWPPGFLFE
jgi:hypothetical protein